MDVKNEECRGLCLDLKEGRGGERCLWLQFGIVFCVGIDTEFGCAFRSDQELWEVAPFELNQHKGILRTWFGFSGIQYLCD